MKISTLLTLFPLLMPASVLAGTVLYTDSHYPPTNNDASVTVIYLDGPEQ
ncbi:TPA: TIGR03757 family integrating conjugative element protein, partial [Serratia marcescens]